MPPRTTIWARDAHSEGKHLVLRYYLETWLPILTSWNSRVLFIDAFAGPGEYAEGEQGSPVIALRALIDHRARHQMRNEVRYFFIEKSPERCEHLIQVLSELKHELPTNCKYVVINSTFDEKLTEALDQIDQQNVNLAPAFVMIDSFGVSETPMKTVGRILANPTSEVYITFMYDAISRFSTHPNFESHLDELFGCPDWRKGMSVADSRQKQEFFFDLYKNQLKKNGAQYVVHFELYEGNKLVYAIFFGTKHLEGCDRMKQAIWKVAPFGDFKFRSSRLNQFTLGPELMDISPLKFTLREHFIGRGWQRIEDIINFVKSDRTDFHSGHLKTKTLKPMENTREIEIKEGTRKQKGTYPDGTQIRFL